MMIEEMTGRREIGISSNVGWQRGGECIESVRKAAGLDRSNQAVLQMIGHGIPLSVSDGNS